jgi:hypothetical protein
MAPFIFAVTAEDSLDQTDDRSQITVLVRQESGLWKAFSFLKSLSKDKTGR